MTVQFIHIYGGNLPTHAPASLPAGVLALDGWADRFIVDSYCVWAGLLASQARAQAP